MSTIAPTTMTLSNALFHKAKHYIPGGVNSPVRAFTAVHSEPRFIAKAKGAYLFDVDNNTLIDYVGSWGPMIVGHAHPDVLSAVHQSVDQGLSYGAPCQNEVTLAKMIVDLIPSIDQIRMVNSGTEATMSALRLARGITKRNKIIKFDGCYHGHSDTLLVKAGSGSLTLNQPSSPGVPSNVTKDTLIAPYNDLKSVQKLFHQHAQEVAAIIIEPIAGNMNMIKAQPDFISGLRRLCNQYGTLLIFDEVMTGFRVALGGAQSLYGIEPDLTCFGKVIGGGMPVGAYAGKEQYMREVAPNGPIYQAGTLSGNPVAMAAGIATLKLIQQPNFFKQLHQKTQQLALGLKNAAHKANVPLRVTYQGGMFGFAFTEKDPVVNLSDVLACDQNVFSSFFQSMLEQGVYLAPSAFEAGFVSSAHSQDDIARTLAAAEKAFAALT